MSIVLRQGRNRHNSLSTTDRCSTWIQRINTRHSHGSDSSNKGHSSRIRRQHGSMDAIPLPKCTNAHERNRRYSALAGYAFRRHSDRHRPRHKRHYGSLRIHVGLRQTQTHTRFSPLSRDPTPTGRHRTNWSISRRSSTSSSRPRSSTRQHTNIRRHHSSHYHSRNPRPIPHRHSQKTTQINIFKTPLFLFSKIQRYAAKKQNGIEEIKLIDSRTKGLERVGGTENSAR